VLVSVSGEGEQINPVTPGEGGSAEAGEESFLTQDGLAEAQYGQAEYGGLQWEAGAGGEDQPGALFRDDPQARAVRLRAEQPAGAVFALPLIVGAIRAGVLGLYRGAPGPLSGRQFGDLLILADAATVMLLGSDHGDAENGDGAALDGQAPDLALHRAEIDQATGMLTVQLGVPVAEAFARLRAYAYSQDRRLADVAGDIVARRIRLGRDPGQDGGP